MAIRFSPPKPVTLDVRDFGAAGDNTADDRAALQAAVNACPAGGAVALAPGQYRITAPLVIPPNVILRGTLGYRYQQYTGTPVFIKPYFGNFTGTALIQCTDEADGWQLQNVALSGVGATAVGGGPIHGLSALGYVKGVKLQDVLITNFTGDGIHTDTSATGQPGGWECRGLYVSACNGYGWYSADSAAKGIAFTDSKILQSEFAANDLDGMRIDGGPTNDFVAVWFTWNGGNGCRITAKASNLQFTGCQTDRNGKNGWYLLASEQISTNPSPRVVTLTGCIANRDGRNGNAGQGGYAGLRVEGTSSGTPHIGVVANGFSTHVGVDDDNTGQRSPDYGLFLNNASVVLASAGYLQGTLASVSDDNEALVDQGDVFHSVSDFTTGTVTVAGLQGGLAEPRPADYGYRAWNYDPITASGSTAPTAGVIYLQRIDLRRTTKAAKVVYGFPSTAGMALTTGQCFVGIYDLTGTRKALSADIAASITSNEIGFALTATATLTPGSYWVALLLNGTTLPTVARASGQISGQGQSQITASKARFGSILTGQTSLPSTITPGSVAKISAGQNYWAALA